jgi:ABC-2 type transport system ATP-binding protein
VSVNADSERVTKLFKSVNGVKSVQSLYKKGPGYRYALDLGDQNELAEAAPSIANKIMTAGFKLYALQHESRDLETIFGEISAQKERVQG